MIFDRVIGLLSYDIGIDLGTANTIVCVRGRGIVLMEPSVVAVKRGTNQVLLGGTAVGAVAKEMLDKTPSSIQAIRPLKDGVVADFAITEAMIRYFIRRAHNRRWGIRPRVLLAVPAGINQVEKRAVIESTKAAGAREVFLIEEPKAAGIGVGLPITEPRGNMIVDIGGGTTEVAVMSLGDIVTHQSLRVAGDEMDEGIIQHMRKAYNMEIGRRTAEQVKIELGSAYPLEEEKTMEVKGKDFIKGMPRKEVIDSQEVREALKEPVQAIINAIRVTLEQTPPELAADLVDSGMVLCGGGCQIRGLDLVIERETGLPARRASDPISAVARGTEVVLDQLDLMRGVLESGEDEL